MSGLIKNTAVTFVSRILYAILQLILRFGIALFLGATIQGEYFTFLQIVLFGALFFSIGQGQAAIYSIGKNKNAVKGIVSSSFFFNILWLPLISLTVVLLGRYTKQYSVFDVSSVFFKTAVFGAALTAFFQIGSRLLIGAGHNLLFNLYNIISVLINILLFILFGHILDDILTAAVIAYILSITAGIVLVYLTLFIKYGIRLKIFDETFISRQIYGIVLSLSVIIAFVNYRIDFFMVRTFLGSYQAGLYSVAVMLAEIVWFVPDAVTIAFFPDISGRSKEEGERLAPVVSRHTVFLSFVFSLLVLIFSFVFLATIGKEYSASMRPFLILLTGTMIYSNCKILSVVLLSRRELSIANMASFGILIINAAVNYILIPKYGISGAAAASVAAYSCGTVFALVYFSKSTKTGLIDMILVKKKDFRLYKKIIYDKCN